MAENYEFNFDKLVSGAAKPPQPKTPATPAEASSSKNLTRTQRLRAPDYLSGRPYFAGGAWRNMRTLRKI